MNDELRERMARAIQGELTAAEAAELASHCRANPEAAGELARLLETERLLALAHVAPDPSGFTEEVVQRLSADSAQADRAARRVLHTLRRRRAGRTLLALAACLAVAFTAAWSALTLRPPARVLRVESASWAGPARVPGERLRDGGRVALDRGLVEIRFARGSRVLVEGPADLEIRGRSSAFLHRGRVVADVPEADHGFRIDSPRGRVIDLGTSFGISVDGSGATEVHVIEGRVRAGATGQPDMVELGADEALRLHTGGATRMSADPSAFFTAMPPPAASTPNFIHWTLNEGAGLAAADSGRGLGEANTRLELRALPPGREVPAWTDGPFGKALAFNGRSAYGETAYRGIEGDRARTVAAWVRVPADFRSTDGFAILSWGNYSRDGAAWQFSINPLAAEGDMGRLRLGTNRGYVIGTTDLRDGQWHHVAAVLYGAARPNTGTHVMLYVDGRLEPASARTVRDIHTAVDPDAHGIWVGRNLASDQPAYSGGAFFRGALDEIVIADSALSQAQVLRLMREGRL